MARCARNELIRHIEFLHAENQILRSRLGKRHVVLKPDEKARLLELGAAIGPKLKQLITVVSYNTYLRWKRNAKHKKPAQRMGRPKTSDEIRELILQMARETDWGYTRIMGELKKLGLKPPSKTTVKNILRSEGHDPGPKRGEGSWEEFLKMHADTLWQCDFFSQRILTKTGFRQVFVLAFLHVATRRVIVSPSTFGLGDDWVRRQTETFFEEVRSAGLECELVMRDNDSNYQNGFDQVVQAHGAQVRPTAIRAPNQNAYIERFVQTIQQECLDHFLVFGLKYFDYLMREFVPYCHHCRPYQGIGNVLLPKSGGRPPEDSFDTVPLDYLEIKCEERLGGLLRPYYRQAA